MNKYTDTQLQTALAKMLPAMTTVVYEENYSREDHYLGTDQMIVWIEPKVLNNFTRQVKDTEWLHVCWLVEDQEVNKIAYLNRLGNVVKGSLTKTCTEADFHYLLLHATWQQRAEALAQVKRIEIV